MILMFVHLFRKNIMSLLALLPLFAKFQNGEAVASELLQAGLVVASNLTTDPDHKATIAHIASTANSNQEFASSALNSLGKLLGYVSQALQTAPTQKSAPADPQ
jgi:hypothetical protein